MLTLLGFDSIGQAQETAIAQKSVKALTDVMVHDITSPLVASRNYAYTLIAFYEAARQGDKSFKSYAGQLSGLDSLPAASPELTYNWLVAGVAAFHKTGYALIFSKTIFERSWDSIHGLLRKQQVPIGVYNRSVALGEAVADHVLQWAREDNYLHTRMLPRFTQRAEKGYWQQTPPDYMEAIEPYWNQIRPMTLSKPGQFTLPRPALYNSDQFKDACREVYETGLKLSKEQTAIANFWDCNPYATQTIGHLVYSVKKISPGGHWMGITGLAIKQKKQGLTEALLAYSLVSVAIFDALIAAWDEKYTSNYIRPVTAIQQLISPTWQPLLQTPPFPEYPSGHSVISMAAAVVLTRLYGEAFNYTDDVERDFGIRDRSFHSFYQAADEAAISRLYGGIHFRQAVENGKDLGRTVGTYVLQKVNLR